MRGSEHYNLKVDQFKSDGHKWLTIFSMKMLMKP